MDFCLATFAAVFVFLIAASGAPTGNQDACAEVRASSLELNQHAKTASVKARNGSTDVVRYSDSLAWVEANDLCDPVSLKQQSTPCVEKIFGVLTSYTSEVEKISAFESCSELTSAVSPALKKLHRDMGKCVRSLGGKHEKKHHGSKAEHQPVWKEDYLCRHTLERLFSFSILTARVFAVGDPAHHSEGSAQRCS